RDAVLGDERGQLGDAVVDVPHHPGLGNPGFVAIPGRLVAGLGEEARIELAAISLRGADGGPVALAVVRDEAASDDTDAIVRRIAPGCAERTPPWIEHLLARALGKQVGVEARGTARAALGHGGDPERRAAGLHVARPDHHVVEGVAFPAIAEALAREAAS